MKRKSGKGKAWASLNWLPLIRRQNIVTNQFINKKKVPMQLGLFSQEFNKLMITFRNIVPTV
jgi:hypothetical protein